MEYIIVGSDLDGTDVSGVIYLDLEEAGVWGTLYLDVEVQKSPQSQNVPISFLGSQRMFTYIESSNSQFVQALRMMEENCSR